MYVQYRLMNNIWSVKTNDWYNTYDNICELEYLKDTINKTNNLFNFWSKGNLEGYSIDSNGIPFEYASENVSHYIKVKPSTNYICNKALRHILWFDASLNPFGFVGS